MSESLLLGRCDSTDFVGDRRAGLKRARLAFVGDMYEARRLEFGSPSREWVRDCVLSVVIAAGGEGDVFLRLVEVGSISFRIGGDIAG